MTSRSLNPDTRYTFSTGESAHVALENIRGELDVFLASVEPHLAHALEADFGSAMAKTQARGEAQYLRETIVDQLSAQLLGAVEASAEWFAEDPLSVPARGSLAKRVA